MTFIYIYIYASKTLGRLGLGLCWLQHTPVNPAALVFSRPRASAIVRPSVPPAHLWASHTSWHRSWSLHVPDSRPGVRRGLAVIKEAVWTKVVAVLDQTYTENCQKFTSLSGFLLVFMIAMFNGWHSISHNISTQTNHPYSPVRDLPKTGRKGCGGDWKVWLGSWRPKEMPLEK